MSKPIRILALLIIIFAFQSVTFAQDESTGEPEPATTQEVIATPAPVESPVESPVIQDGSDLSINLVQVIIGLLTAFAAGGVVGIAGLAIFVDRIRDDKATVTALEKLAESYPPNTRELLLGISKTTISLGELGKEIFDDTPVIDKPDPDKLE